MIIVIITVMIDSGLDIVADFIPEQISSIWGIGVFLGIAIIFVVHITLFSISNKLIKRIKPGSLLIHSLKNFIN
jgi:cytosine/uracil/thiamine/allantoin permease